MTRPNSAIVELCNSAEKSIRLIDKLHVDLHVLKRVKAHTLTYVLLTIIHIHSNFTCVSHDT